jgi:nucleotide-binding universal stress UspA family protein
MNDGYAAMKISKPFSPSRLLCPIDFSDLADLALKYAAAGAQAFKASVTVFHSQRFELPPYFTRGQIDDLTRQHRAEQAKAREFLKLHVRRVLGDQASALQLKFDLADAHPVDGVWLGSVTENVVRQARVPVFVARQKQHEFVNLAEPQSTPSLRTILCPVNSSPVARLSLESAASLARKFNARLLVACILEPGDARGPAEARQELSHLLQDLTVQCEVNAVTSKGLAGERIVSLAEEKNADLIVVGAQNSHPSRPWHWGDTTEFVLRRAPAPVLVVPG